MLWGQARVMEGWLLRVPVVLDLCIIFETTFMVNVVVINITIITISISKVSTIQ